MLCESYVGVVPFFACVIEFQLWLFHVEPPRKMTFHVKLLRQRYSRIGIITYWG